MTRSKLFRNLKPGDKFSIYDTFGHYAIVTVSSVQKVSKGYFTGRKQWQINGNYPWWWPRPILADSKEKVELL